MAVSDRQLVDATLLEETPLLDFSDPLIARLVESRGWDDADVDGRAQALYDFVRDEIPFGYNRDEAIPASRVLQEGFGQCNTKGTLLMALLRRCGVPCRLHVLTVDKRLQAGLIPASLLARLPASIVHSWVEAHVGDEWIVLEGVIVDTSLLSRIQSRFPAWRGSFCGFGLACDDLHDPPVAWSGTDTYIQHRAVDGDLGVYPAPDTFYAEHRPNVSGLKGLVWRWLYFRPTNRTVARVRSGWFPSAPERFVTTVPGGAAQRPASS
jgi:Transglutaminase-like superfamily